MKEQYIKLILKYVQMLCPNVRKPKYTSEYYLNNILDLVNDFNSWRSLKKSVNLDKRKRYHYKTIADIHRLWCQKGVYKKAFEEARNQFIDTEECQSIDLLIDSTLIINKNGIDFVGYGGETMKKRFTKLNIIGNKDTILNVTVAKTNDKVVVFGKSKGEKEKRPRGRPRKVLNEEPKEPIVKQVEQKQEIGIIIQTLEHDIKGIIPTLKDIDVLKRKHINLIGDKGYIADEETKKRLCTDTGMKVKLITPYRKNQKKKNTVVDKKKLRTRSTIERKIRTAKQYNRIHVRKDQKVINYMGFFYVGVLYAL